MMGGAKAISSSGSATPPVTEQAHAQKMLISPVNFIFNNLLKNRMQSQIRPDPF